MKKSIKIQLYTVILLISSLFTGLKLSHPSLTIDHFSYDINNSDSPNSVDLYAIIVGIMDYQDPNNYRLFADLDAERFYNLLTQNFRCDPGNIIYLINENATQENILSAFDSISSKADINDKFIFYYAGHGLVDDPPTNNFSKTIQTPHSYGPQENILWNITHSNATAIRVHFSAFASENGLDSLYMGSTNTVSSINYDKKYSGQFASDFWSDYIPANNGSIYMRFLSNLDTHYYGFQIDKYQIINASSESQGICPSNYFQNSSKFINDTLLNQKLDTINSDKKFLFFDSDFSGGILSEIADTNIFAISSTGKNELNILDSDSTSGAFSRFLFEAFYLNEVDINNNSFNSIEEIFAYTNSSTIHRSTQLGRVINPQFSDGINNQSYIFPAIYDTMFDISNKKLTYNFTIDGIFEVDSVNILIFNASNNLFSNYTLDPSSISNTGYGTYSSIINNEHQISSVGVTVVIGSNISIPFFLYVDEKEDFDNDNLTDIYEIIIGTNPTRNDTDSDSIYDNIELSIGSNPLKNDTDSDGMSDGWEYLNNLNFLNGSDNLSDYDSDNLLNIYEFLNGTDPQNKDSDFDDMWDDWEVLYSLNPLDSSDNISDYDGDGMLAVWEYLNFSRTNPDNPDCDSDGINDFWEWGNGTDPWSNDTDNDNLLDFAEIVEYKTDPTSADSDSDGLTDGDEILIYFTNPLLNDTDNDMLSDAEEIYIGTNATNPDSDGDGIDDYEEVFIGEDGYITDPNNKDTDGDGQDDLFEIRGGTDPTDPNSKSELWWQLPLIFGSIGGIIIFSFIYKKSKIWRFNRIMKLSKEQKSKGKI